MLLESKCSINIVSRQQSLKNIPSRYFNFISKIQSVGSYLLLHCDQLTASVLAWLKKEKENFCTFWNPNDTQGLLWVWHHCSSLLVTVLLLPIDILK